LGQFTIHGISWKKKDQYVGDLLEFSNERFVLGDERFVTFFGRVHFGRFSLVGWWLVFGGVVWYAVFNKW